MVARVGVRTRAVDWTSELTRVFLLPPLRSGSGPPLPYLWHAPRTSSKLPPSFLQGPYQDPTRTLPGPYQDPTKTL